MVFARDALRVAIATVRSALEFYTRAARGAPATRDLELFLTLADEERSHLAALDGEYKVLLDANPQLESRPTMLFFKDAANGLFARGAGELDEGGDLDAALSIGARCERGAHEFFKQYGEQLASAEGRRVFLSLAETKRSHLQRLWRAQRAKGRVRPRS